MKLYTIPVIRTADPKKWYVEYYYHVPPDLREYYTSKTVRFRVFGDINRYPEEERLPHAEKLQAKEEYKLKVLGYNPFESKLKELEVIKYNLTLDNLSPEEQRKLTPVSRAFELFLESKIGEVDPKTVTTYRNTVSWLNEYFIAEKLDGLKISEVTRLHLATAVKEARKNRKWKSNTTYNKELEFSMTIFNWLEAEEYIIKNPASGKLKKLRTIKNKHKWYDKETAKIAKEAMIGKTALLLACQFTYWLMIRSKSELRALKIADIDQTLKRIRFSSALSKNNTEQYRDYTPEFQKVLDGMDLKNYPKHYYVFGTKGTPGFTPCSHNWFSKQWETIREKAGLSTEHTIYAWKHTRIIHLMMQGVDGYQISHMARHGNTKTTEDYKRDYDYTLVNIYKAEDLTF